MIRPYSLISAALILFMLFCRFHTAAYASERETELFNKGYEYLFSYKPDKAAEVFRTFLNEFPESSARDAALFWLGKTLISLKSYQEAEQVLQALKNAFPDSPFLSFIDVEMEEIARARSATTAKGLREAAESAKGPLPRTLKEEITSAGSETKPAEELSELERSRSLLAAERKTATERQSRIADLEAKEALLRKQNAELELQAGRLAGLEKGLQEATAEKERISSELARVSSERKQAEKERDGLRAMVTASEQKITPEPLESLRLKISELEALSLLREDELKAAREAAERTVRLLEEEKRSSAELKKDLALLKEKERDTTLRIASAEEMQKAAKEMTGIPVAEHMKLTAEIVMTKEQLSRLQDENRRLSGRIAEMEEQAGQRTRDMKILNAYLTKLMFQKKPEPQVKQDPKQAEEIEKLRSQLIEEKARAEELQKKIAASEAKEAELKNMLEHAGRQKQEPAQIQEKKLPEAQPSSPSPGAVGSGDRDIFHDKVIAYQTNAATVMQKMGVRDMVWRTGNPKDDYIRDDLLVLEAERSGAVADPVIIKELSEKHGMSREETEILRRFLLIGKLIDMKHGMPGEAAVELLSVDYKPGDSSKPVLATDLQAAARAGKSFEEIRNSSAGKVSYARMSLQDFSSRYREKSQIIQKLDFTSNETVVIWSEKGYMLIRPVMLRTPFNPFAETKKEDGEKIRATVTGLLEELKKGK